MNRCCAHRALTKTYTMGKRSLEVLRGVDLDVARGEFLALRGASGAGKSTLLHLIGGLDSPNAGEIFFDGQNLVAFSERELTRLPQPPRRFCFSGVSSAAGTDRAGKCLPARAHGADCQRASCETRGRELLARVGLKDRLEHKPSELSGGEQQRVAIARALINEPELILADEPTGNLDSQTGGEIIELLKSLRVEKQTTLVIATHDAKVAANAERVIELVDGRIQIKIGLSSYLMVENEDENESRRNLSRNDGKCIFKPAVVGGVCRAATNPSPSGASGAGEKPGAELGGGEPLADWER